MSIDSIQAEGNPRYERDRLTGALVRPHFIDLLAIEKRFADHTGRAFLLLLADVDQLRNVNEQAGHAAGDQVLKSVVDRLRDTMDMPPWSKLNYLHARYDGDGLMVLLRCCELEQGAHLAETLRSRVVSARYRRDLRATVSIGVAAYRIGECVDDVLGRVERTLFLAKQAGRDCVEVAQQPTSPGHSAKVIAFPSAKSPVSGSEIVRQVVD